MLRFKIGSRTRTTLLGIAFAASSTYAMAASVPQLGSDATSSDLIELLTPKTGITTQPLIFRGLKLLTAEPATGRDGPMPAVGLDIRFRLGQAQLSEIAKETIKQLATAIQSEQLSRYHFVIEGHTDSTGRFNHNLVLSKLRAEAVQDYLITSYGVSASRLVAVGRGPTQPLDPADPTNPANRRVQVVNVGDRLAGRVR